MENVNEQSKPNILMDIHTRLIALPIRIRDLICDECGFSIPTAYRKMRTADQLSESGRMITAFSTAEREMIIKIVDSELKSIGKYLEKYRTNDEK